MAKIKGFFNKIINIISDFLHKIGEKKGNLFKKLFATKFMQKVGYGLSYYPKKWTKNMTHAQKKGLWGILFIIPSMIGLVYFFLLPFISTVIYSFSNVVRVTDVGVTGEVIGTVTEWTGFDNYKYVWNVHGSFKETLFGAFGSTLLDVVLILIFSLIIAVVLNSNFRGRAFVRAIFFLPVVFNSEAITAALNAAEGVGEMLNKTGDGALTQLFDLAKFMEGLGVPVKLVKFLTDITSAIYRTISYSGIQILVFLTAIQSVPKHLYEAATIEGATGYEQFWKITLPMVSPMIVTVVVYTIVDSFLRSEICDIMDIVYRDSEYGYYAAMSWIYILASLLIMGVIVGILSKVVFYYDEKK